MEHPEAGFEVNIDRVVVVGHFGANALDDRLGTTPPDLRHRLTEALEVAFQQAPELANQPLPDSRHVARTVVDQLLSGLTYGTSAERERRDGAAPRSGG